MLLWLGVDCDVDRSSVRGKLLCRFDAFIARKSRAAVAAELPPYNTELERPLDGMLAIGSPWTERLFDKMLRRKQPRDLVVEGYDVNAPEVRVPRSLR